MILLIDNYDSFTYNLYQMVSSLGEEVFVVRNDQISGEEILKKKLSGIILSPGPGRPEEAGICVELLQNLIRMKRKLPLLGVCLGHQAIGYALGSKIVAADEIMHGKSDFIFHHRKNFYQKMPLPFEAGRYHSLVVERRFLASELVVEAENGGGVIMGMRHHELPIFGIQFHPESILTPHGKTLLEGFIAETKSNH